MALMSDLAFLQSSVWTMRKRIRVIDGTSMVTIPVAGPAIRMDGIREKAMTT